MDLSRLTVQKDLIFKNLRASLRQIAKFEFPNRETASYSENHLTPEAS